MSIHGDHALRISQVEPNHLIERNATSAVHLPQTSNPRLHFQYAPSVPCLIGRDFIRNRRARSDQ